MFEVNFLAVFAAAIASFFVGFLGYGPLFGKQWMKLVGMTQKDMEKTSKSEMNRNMIVSFLASVVMAYVLANFVQGAGEFLAAFQTVFWI